MKVFILAAGHGVRLKPLTETLPKVMIKIGGKPVLEHLLNLCRHHGFKNIIINLHHLPDTIVRYFDNGYKFGVNINYSHEKEQILGGAGALKNAESLLTGQPFFVFNGDMMTNLNLTAMAEFHRQKRGLATFLVHQTDHPFDSDLVESDRNFLIQRFYRPRLGSQFQPVAKSGVHIFAPQALDYIPQNQVYSLEQQLIPNLLKQGQKLYAYYSDCYAKDMGTPERLKQVRRDYQDGLISF